MDSKKFPKAVFMGNIIEINSVDFTKDGTYKVTVKGNLEIHGVKKEITAPGTITIKGGKINSKSVFKITVTDYGIKGGLIGQKIASTVEVTVDCKYD
jgi:polyisoprenoid-binding protein YceI